MHWMFGHPLFMSICMVGIFLVACSCFLLHWSFTMGENIYTTFCTKDIEYTVRKTLLQLSFFFFYLSTFLLSFLPRLPCFHISKYHLTLSHRCMRIAIQLIRSYSSISNNASPTKGANPYTRSWNITTALRGILPKLNLSCRGSVTWPLCWTAWLCKVWWPLFIVKSHLSFI